MKILEWNINGRSNTNYVIPKFVSQKIMDVDIAILTEFSSLNIEFIKMLNESGYSVFYNQIRKEKNKILIAIKNETISSAYGIKINETLYNPCGYEEPNFLQITIEINNKKVIIIGTRLRVGNEEFLEEQFKVLKTHLEIIDSAVICAGDFNVWSSYIKRRWQLHPEDYQFYTPWYSGGYQNPNKWSHVGMKSNQTYKSLIDHFITKDIRLSNVDYSWDFLNDDEKYKYFNPEDYKSNLIGYPDHAILQANIEV